MVFSVSAICDGWSNSLMFEKVVYFRLCSLSFYPYLHYKPFSLLNLLCFQPDSLDDLSYAIMYETTKLAYRVSEDDVTRARNQVGFYSKYWFLGLLIECDNGIWPVLCTMKLHLWMDVFIVQDMVGVMLSSHLMSLAYCIYSIHLNALL